MVVLYGQRLTCCVEGEKMKPAKKRGRGLLPPRTMEEEAELFTTEHPVSASEDEDDGDAARRRHRKLLDAISALGGQKRKKLSERTEAGLQVSEFGISAEGAGEKINLTDLLKPIKKVTRLSTVKKQLNKLKETKSVALPLSREETQKIQRIVSYKHTSEEISKWDNVVKENCKAEKLVFSLNDQPLKPVPIGDTVACWKASTPLKIEIFSILHKNKQPITDPLLTPLEEASLKAMSLGEAKRRRAELQKARALQSYYEAKARREKKIKSKKYHKLLKKVKKKETLKRFEALRQMNPDAALEELEKIERARMQERMSLKHQNSGKWAKSKVIMAKYNEGARRAMQEQLQKNKELTRKIAVVSEEDEKEKAEEIIPDFVNDAQMSLEGANPWMTGKLRSDAKDPEAPEETQMEEVIANVNTDEQEDDDEEESEDETLLRDFEARRRLRKDLGEQKVLEAESGSAARSTTEDSVGEVSRFNALFQRLLEQNKKEDDLRGESSAPGHEEPKIPEEQVEKEGTLELEEAPLLIESLERNRTLEDLEALAEQELPDTGRCPQAPPLRKTKEKISKPAGKKERRSDLIDSENILPAKERPVQAPILPTVVEEEDEEEVVGADGGRPPGVGVRHQRGRFTHKAPPAAPRKHCGLPNVFINEKRNIAAAAHQVNELPFPFNSREHFESSIRAPVGNTWNTEAAVQKLTTPRVITKRGHIIEPITEDVFQKHSATKKTAMELEKPKTRPNPRTLKRAKKKKKTGQ